MHTYDFSIHQLPTNSVSLNNIYQAVYMVDQALGSGYYVRASVKSTRYWIGMVEDKVVAFSSVYEPDGLHQAALLKFNVVDTAFRGNGYGSAMVQIRLKFLLERGFKTIRSNAWVNKGRCPAARSLEKNGFKAVENKQGAFEADYNYQYPCEICGPTCNCKAIVYEYE